MESVTCAEDLLPVVVSVEAGFVVRCTFSVDSGPYMSTAAFGSLWCNGSGTSNMSLSLAAVDRLGIRLVQLNSESYECDKTVLKAKIWALLFNGCIPGPRAAGAV
jgi:hypothetical protein